jgi:hypothetical protein
MQQAGVLAAERDGPPTKARGIRGVDEFANHKRRCPDRISAGQGICLVRVAGFEPTASSIRYTTYAAFQSLARTGIHLQKRRLPATPHRRRLSLPFGVLEG